MLSLVPDSVLGRVAASYTAPPPTPVAPALGRAYDAACRDRGPESASRLHDATAALVHRLKSDALPPERVVVAVKAALTKYGGLHVPPSLAAEAHDAAGMRRAAEYRNVFGWFLEAYFGRV